MCLIAPALAKKEDPLERMKPVPANEPIPVIDFFRPRVFTNPELNPAGTHFAAIISTRDDRLDLIAFDLATKKAERISGGTDHDIANHEWLNDRRLLFSVIRDKLYASGLFAVELGRFSQSYALERRNAITPVGFPKNNPLHAIIWIRHSARDNGADGGVLKIDTRRSMDAKDGMIFMNGDDGIRADIVQSYPAPPEGVPTRYMADHTGELAFAITSKDGRPTLYRYVEKKWERSPLNLGRYSLVGVGDKTDELLVLAAKKPEKPRALHRFNAATGELGELLYQDDEYDIADGRFSRHPVNNRVLGVQYNRKGPQSIWFDEAYKLIQARLDQSFPNEWVRIIGSDREEKQFFVSVFSDVNPGAYYRVELKTSSAQLITNVTPWIDPARMRPMHVLSYKTRDGHDMQAYVTMPAGASKENPAPMVVLPHGGPWARDNWGWDAEAQFFASRGYAVLQPNYRGSTGSAWRFPSEDMWSFTKMHDDVTDAVKAALKTGLVDQDRLAIMGGSFGGYLALSGAAHEPDLYRCAISVAGVFDWERVIKDSKNSEYARGAYGLLRRKLGDPKLMQEKFESISPIKHVAKIKIPIFVAHGVEDQRATIAQSKELIKELKKHSLPYEKQIERGEGHGFRHVENQVELYTAVEAFLGKHLTKRAAPTAKTAESPKANELAAAKP